MPVVIEALIIALICIGIVCIIGYVLMSIIPGPPMVKTIVWAVVGIICLLILLRAVTGHGLAL